MPSNSDSAFNGPKLLTQFHEHGVDFGDYPGWMFRRCVIYFDKPVHHSSGLDGFSFDIDSAILSQIVEFAGGRIVDDVEDTEISHIVIGEDKSKLKGILEIISRFVDLVHGFRLTGTNLLTGDLNYRGWLRRHG
jgi:DNA ligase-4